ncbi:sigma-70 family RNA polymerase sigma factor [Candidatus Palauibacter irciniicola]|uniref:sigma-70 family RNA polymerase sigma factor n=1 Tax=Candidatus Palauibacter irciniicola TaxID=3056733 RepID=UPI003B0280F1
MEGRTVDFEAAYKSHWTPLFRYVDRMVGDADLAADVVQEAFVRLLDQALPDEEVRRWLFTVATNLVRDDARMSARRRRLLSQRYEQTDLAHDPVESPDQPVLRAERVAAVRAALAEMPERDRQLLLMREEGFRYAEIAEVIEVAPGSVGTLLARALRRFTEALDPRIVEDETGRGR